MRCLIQLRNNGTRQGRPDGYSCFVVGSNKPGCQSAPFRLHQPCTSQPVAVCYIVEYVLPPSMCTPVVSSAGAMMYERDGGACGNCHLLSSIPFFCFVLEEGLRLCTHLIKNCFDVFLLKAFQPFTNCVDDKALLVMKVANIEKSLSSIIWRTSLPAPPSLLCAQERSHYCSGRSKVIIEWSVCQKYATCEKRMTPC